MNDESATQAEPNAFTSGSHVASVHLRLHDLDEARVLFARMYGELAKADALGPLDWRLRRSTFAGVGVVFGLVANGIDLACQGPPNRLVLVSTRARTLAAHASGRQVIVEPHRSAVVLSPDRPVRLRSDAGYETFTTAIEVPVLEEHLRALAGEPLRGKFEFDPAVNLETSSGDSFLRIANAFAHEMNRPGSSPLLLAAMKDALLTSILTCLRHNRIDRLLAPVKKAAPTYLRKAEELMCAHLDEPLTLTGIAKEVGISVRSLQVAFQEKRGSSPMQFLKERRLEHARKRLLTAKPGTTVAAVAIAAGMDHLGRFSVEYKKRFGESPSDTLRRRMRVA